VMILLHILVLIIHNVNIVQMILLLLDQVIQLDVNLVSQQKHMYQHNAFKETTYMIQLVFLDKHILHVIQLVHQIIQIVLLVIQDMLLIVLISLVLILQVVLHIL